jgi:hypothetical protein
MCLFPQTVPLPQLRREQGRAIYVASTGPFGMRNARGGATHQRIVELRRQREVGNTGEIEDWNVLSGMLPQDCRVCIVR